MGGSMTQEQFVIEVLKIASQYNPDLVNSTSYEDVLKELTEIKEKALRLDILTSTFRNKPELFPIQQRALLKETQARQAAMRQGQL